MGGKRDCLFRLSDKVGGKMKLSEKRKLGWLKYGKGYYVYGDKNKASGTRAGPRFWMWLGRVERARGYYAGWYARHARINALPDTWYFFDFLTAREWVVEGVKEYLIDLAKEEGRKGK